MIRLHFLLFCLLTSFYSQAQDPAFSQFYANRIYLNPAFAGAQEGIKLTTSYRKQWTGVTGHFTTYSINVDVQEPCLSTGLSLTAFLDTQGEAALKTTGINAVYAYIIRFGNKGLLSGTNIHIGLQGGFIQQRLDWNKLIFSDQLDPIHGNVNPTAATIGLETVGFADFAGGVVWRQKWKHFPGLRYKKQTIRSAIGVSIHHLHRPENSFNDLSTNIPRRYTIHGGLRIPIIGSNFRGLAREHYFFLLPNFKYEIQGESGDNFNLGETSILSYGMYIQTPSPLYFGVFYQSQNFTTSTENTNAFIVAVGLDVIGPAVDYIIGISYDSNVGGLSTSTKGVLELSLRLRFKEKSFFCAGRFGRKKGTHFKKILDCDKFL
ncbi:MAG: type IX secretion system PorP/SprF family membrane protein [Saprospiraceae bacterium]|jgi:type IX secretion system PorP/SprF family membrane protein